MMLVSALELLLDLRNNLKCDLPSHPRFLLLIAEEM